MSNPSFAYLTSLTSKTVFEMRIPCSSKGFTSRCTLSTSITTGRGSEVLLSSLVGKEAINSLTTATSNSFTLTSLIATLLYKILEGFQENFIFFVSVLLSNLSPDIFTPVKTLPVISS